MLQKGQNLLADHYNCVLIELFPMHHAAPTHIQCACCGTFVTYVIFSAKRLY